MACRRRLRRNRHALERMELDAAKIDSGNLSFERGDDATLVIRVGGIWRLEHGLPSALLAEREMASRPRTRKIAFDSKSLNGWDTSLVNFVVRLGDFCRGKGIDADFSGLPDGLQRLIHLADAVPDAGQAREAAPRQGFVGRVGVGVIGFGEESARSLAFFGEIAIAAWALIRGRARYRGADLLEAVAQCGADALGIVALISFLVGAILAFMGAVQLEQFGASIYVADLVGIGMVRDMGAMMTAIIVAGRTGAAFAARIGTMKVTQEVDALTTMGMSPIEFLALPRILALVLMMPLLCLYSDLLGILGGASVTSGMLGVSLTSYMQQTIHAVTPGDLVGGLIKATVYGLIVAMFGCKSGFECGNSSAAVGEATTKAVVHGIVGIVVACGIFAVIFNILHF